ncbi:MAG: hypothetical protein CO093_10180 [Alphaproteobacteria bacterium CG_4_9_14_3_um_filter_47_13]|nr:MAG: hypothetical protein CO093_10180 [Alphaproteobacteria bacterium CG_4_9_14_3_um_filter_47_13]
MLEAVNSVLQNAPFVRGNTEHLSTADSFAANPDRIQRVAPKAPFVSPFIVVDINYDKAVIQLRNGDTGDVENQFPSEASLQAAAKLAVSRESASLSQQSQDQGQTQAPSSVPQAREQSAQGVAQKISTDTSTTPNTADSGSNKSQSISTQQQAAFHAAAQSGNTNAGNITLFA